MSELKPEVQEQEVQPEPVAVALPGHRLKTKREDLQLTRDEVAHHLHLDVQIINAIEADEYEKLPSPAYVCGYLRSYARLVKLPETEIVNAYSKGQEINAALIPENVSIVPGKQSAPFAFRTLLILVVVGLIAVALMWFVDEFEIFSAKNSSPRTTSIDIPAESNNIVTEKNLNEVQRPAQVQQQIEQFNQQAVMEDVSKQADPAQEKPDETGPLLITEDEPVTVSETINDASTGDLRMVFTEDSWTEVTDANGTRHIYRLVRQGSEVYINGVAPYVILLGNASGVKVYYKEQEFNHKRYQRDQIAYFRLGLKQE